MLVDQYKEWFKRICMTSLLRWHFFELVTRLASYADALIACHTFSPPRGGETRDKS